MSSPARGPDGVIIALRGFFAEEKADEIRSLGDGDNLFDAGVLDSLQLVSLVVFIQSEFGCVLDFDELSEENLASLIAIRDLIQRKRDEAERTDERPAEILGVSHLILSVRDVAPLQAALVANGYEEHGSNPRCPNLPARAPFISGPLAASAEMKLMVAPKGAPALEMICEPAGEEAPVFFEAILSEEPLCDAATVRESLREDSPPGLRGFRRSPALGRASGVGAVVLHCRSIAESLSLWHALGVREEVLGDGLIRIPIRGFHSNNCLHVYLLEDRRDAGIGHLNDRGVVCLSFFCKDADRLRAQLAAEGFEAGECFTLAPFDAPLRIFFVRNASGELYEFLSVGNRASAGES